MENAYALELEALVTTYPSYVNRVYGVRDVDGIEYIAKFYRPDRWSLDAIREEHNFSAELGEAEIPIALPLPDADGDTVSHLFVDKNGEQISCYFTLFPKRAGRLFDAEGEAAWLRIGSLCGRLHNIGCRGRAPTRSTILPDESTRGHLEHIRKTNVVPADIAAKFQTITSDVMEMIRPLFANIGRIRLHGDLHRGNILDRSDEGLLLIDLDDMANGPAMQDLWLLLPGHLEDCRPVLPFLAEGYEQFRPFPWQQLKLVEPLRFMRMIHFIAWCAMQRRDEDFDRHFPDWGSPAWWTKELEDLSDQASLIRRELD